MYLRYQDNKYGHLIIHFWCQNGDGHPWLNLFITKVYYYINKIIILPVQQRSKKKTPPPPLTEKDPLIVLNT